MFFFNDECDFVDEDQYDLFTLSTEIERRCADSRHRQGKAIRSPGRTLQAREARPEIFEGRPL